MASAYFFFHAYDIFLNLVRWYDCKGGLMEIPPIPFNSNIQIDFAAPAQ